MLSSFKGELKSQGAIEAAQDPNNDVTPEDAERVMMNESKKAGATTLKFDPNATPAEKEAQAASRAHHRQRTPKGVGLATDKDDGPDQYDLPSTSNAVSAAVKTTDADGKAVANGGVPEDQRFTKTGWAPRFGSGETEEEKQDTRTLLDHQTFLEGKLDESLFGDWYQNAAVIVFACLSSWAVAMLGGGLAWVFIVMAICGTYYRTSLRRVRRNFRDDINRELIKNKLENDAETMEWMNSFLVKFWPIFAPNLAASIVASVDQVLSTSTPAFLDSMRLEMFTLGTKPPRIESVKTYPKADDDIVLMDWKFSFTPTDTMDMTARQLKNKINPKVVLEVRIGKAMVSKALKIIVEDFAFSGLMRVKMKLQLPFPHVEKVDICFLGKPEIDYVCKPLGGDTFGFDINFIPGLEGFIKDQIHATLAPMMYDPNVFPIEIAKMLSGNPIDLAVGVVAVTIHGAQGLKNPDKFSGTPDPYAVVSLNNRDVLGRTKTISENANPRWNETLYIIITNFTDSLTMSVFDFNDVRKDKELGTASFPLERLESIHEHENLSLEVLANGRPRGVVQSDIRFFPVLHGIKKEDGTELPPPESNTGIARITVEQAKDLDGSKSLVGALNPYAVLLLNGKEIHITKKLKRTNNPIFPDPTKSVLITDRKKARIGMVIKDDRDLTADPILGTYQIKLEDMLTLGSKGQEWFNLAGTSMGRAKMTLDWKPIALKGIEGGSGGYITPIGVMRIHLKSATDLRNVETLGKSDPYAKVMLSGITKGRTVTFQNELNPVWDEVFYVPMHSSTERLTLEVLDEENIGKDRSLGLVEILASDYIKESEQGGWAVHDSKTPHSDGLRMNGQGVPKGKLNYTASFFPTLNVIDPEEEEEERKAKEELEKTTGPSSGTLAVNGGSKRASVASKPSLDVPRKSAENGRISIDSKTMVNGVEHEMKEAPKIRIGTEDLTKYETGLIVFNVIEGTFAYSNCQLEVLMDDHLFPSYVTSKARGKTNQFLETGDAFVRELEMSKITLRLTQQTDSSGQKDEEHVLAKLTGETLTTLQQCLDKPTELTIRGSDGSTSRVTVKLRYLPVQMYLDPSESINNQGNLRVDVLDGADLPSADRNGYSDPYCKFKLNGKEIFKTKTQKKTLHPAWNEYFETPISSRTASELKCDVYDWDFGDKADFLGGTRIDLAALEPFKPQEITLPLDGKSGAVRLKLLFKPSYVTRARQGSSTFAGTFAPAGKVVGAPVKGVGRVGGFIGGGAMKGGSFLKRGFTQKGSKDESMEVNGTGAGDSAASTPQGTPSRAAALASDPLSTATSGSPTTPLGTPHSRQKSFNSTNAATPTGADTGTATFSVLSATGYPTDANIRVEVKMMGSKGGKALHKTKDVKESSGTVEYNSDRETFKTKCAADSQFQVVVQAHGTFKSQDLGEGVFFVSDQGSGSEQTVKAGAGQVVIRSSFAASGNEGYAESLKPSISGRDSPDSKRESRRSFFGRRDVSGKHES